MIRAPVVFGAHASCMFFVNMALDLFGMESDLSGHVGHSGRFQMFGGLTQMLQLLSGFLQGRVIAMRALALSRIELPMGQFVLLLLFHQQIALVPPGTIGFHFLQASDFFLKRSSQLLNLLLVLGNCQQFLCVSGHRFCFVDTSLFGQLLSLLHHCSATRLGLILLCGPDGRCDNTKKSENECRSKANWCEE